MKLTSILTFTQTINPDCFMTNKTNTVAPKQVLSMAIWPVIFISQVVVAALIAWHLLAQFSFAYPLAYDALDIDQHIAKFGPLNRYRPDFETTDKAQHLELFAAIGNAIQNDGKGLADITYTTGKGREIKLLRNAEVVHLEDVAKLVNVFYLTGAGAVILLIASLGIAWHQKLKIPSLKAIAIGVGFFVLSVLLIVFGVGPKDLFYWLHVQVFPPDHEWFFYYQDSLMTTLMKAPQVFGFIGAVLGGLLLIFWVLEIIAMRVILKSKN